MQKKFGKISLAYHHSGSNSLHIYIGDFKLPVSTPTKVISIKCHIENLPLKLFPAIAANADFSSPKSVHCSFKTLKVFMLHAYESWKRTFDSSCKVFS